MPKVARPEATAIPPSRIRRKTELSTGVRLGRKFKASRSRMMVTTSTVICVIAKSGALRNTKATETISPTIPIRIRDSNRRSRASQRVRPETVHSRSSQPTPPAMRADPTCPHRDHADGRGNRPAWDQGKHQPMRAEQDGVMCFFQHHFLGQETVQQRDTRHRQRRNRGDPKCDGHQVPQAPETANVACVGLVINDPCGHEQRGLESCMVEDMKNRRHRAKSCTRAQQHRDQAQMAYCRKGQQSLEIMFKQRNHCAQNHGEPLPLMKSYLGRLEGRLNDEGVTCNIFLMHSGGGIISLESAAEFPVRLVESGPAGGAVFAASYRGTLRVGQGVVF
ncbi:hypothetical protein GQR58_030064 [Nymphon striatum]|nr:hypothetical protein GQR58_030064 [Nymphon striatum]